MSEELYDVWWTDESEGEQAMEEGHHRHWQKTIDMMLETDIRDCSVLDFGCNQGGFLRFLYGQRPFARGVGIDLARQSIEVATSRKGDLPLTYVATSTLRQYEGVFDLAVSSAVIYLIDDLAHHAKEIRHALKANGVYYATYTDYSGNPSLPAMRDLINQHGAIPMQEHTLDDIAISFQKEGFAVSLRRMQPEGYIPIQLPDRFFLSTADRMQYLYGQAYIFRFVALDR